MTNIDNLDYSEDLKNIIKKGRESYPYLSGQEIANETFGTQNRIFVGFTCIQDVEKRQTMWGKYHNAPQYKLGFYILNDDEVPDIEIFDPANPIFSVFGVASCRYNNSIDKNNTDPQIHPNSYFVRLMNGDAYIVEQVYTDPKFIIFYNHNKFKVPNSDFRLYQMQNETETSHFFTNPYNPEHALSCALWLMDPLYLPKYAKASDIVSYKGFQAAVTRYAYNFIGYKKFLGWPHKLHQNKI